MCKEVEKGVRKLVQLWVRLVYIIRASYLKLSPHKFLIVQYAIYLVILT